MSKKEIPPELVEHELSEKEYRRLKAKLQDLEKGKRARFTRFMVMLGFPFLAMMMYVGLLTDSSIEEFSLWGLGLAALLGAVAGCFFCVFLAMNNDIEKSGLKRRILEYEADHVKEEIEDDIFENSIKMSYKYLDQYYLQTREQAQRGFFVTVCVAVFGAVLIFAGIVAMFFEKVEPSYVTCASGVVTEFVAAIFFYLYNKTVSSMSKYHNKLVLSQNISIALKVADSLPDEDKTKAKDLVIAELLKDINAHLVKNDSSGAGDKP